MKKPLVLAASLALAAQAHAAHAQAATWQFKWTPVAGQAAPTVEIMPLKYGKTWAYSFQEDDGGTGALASSQPLFSRYQWNDAPPGIEGGANHPFVGTAAVILGSVGRNSASLSFDQLDELKRKGWGVINHSFWHSGVHWGDPAAWNKPEDYKREMFWSQTFYAELIGRGRAATDFVFPNGTEAYGEYLKPYHMWSGSRVGGSSARNMLDAKYNSLDLSRNYLDEGAWKDSDGALRDLPLAPKSGDFVIDFTHGINADAQSPNNKRWVARLDHIAKTWGPQGDNSMWVAPTDEIVNYGLAARQAKTMVKPNSVSVVLPDTIPGSALTLKISGLNLKTVLKAPTGATLYRKGDVAWLTTPIIGLPGSPPLAPRVRRIYAGEVKDMKWDKPVSVAGVRVRRDGKLSDGFVLKIDAVKPDGTVENIATSDREKLDKQWGDVLYYVMPDRPAISAKELRVTSDKGLTNMEVWAVQP